MKKQYSTPSISATTLQATNMLATSVPVGGTTDDEARSNKFWGETLFDEEDEETEDDGLFL